jgi:type II secretory pathway pseudopilin PulG
VPWRARIVRFVLIVMMASVGATSATLSHDAAVPAARHAARARSRETRDDTRDKIGTLMNNIGMRAEKHHSELRQYSEVGYAMAGLLVAIALLGLLLSLVMPTWQTFVKREKEAELIFRGGQYARAITLYGAQFAGAFPPNIETLVDGRFLRKAYTDPMTDGEFEIITPGTLQTLPGFNPATEAGDTEDAESANDRSNRSPFSQAAEPNRTPFSQAARDQNADTGPVMGVRSRSTETSMMEFDGLDNYADWIFTPTAPGLLGGHNEPQTTLSGGVGAPTPGQPGGITPPGFAQPGGGTPPGFAQPGGGTPPGFAQPGGITPPGFAQPGGGTPSGFAQPGGVGSPGSALPGAFGAPDRGLAPPARGETGATPGRGRTASPTAPPVGRDSGDVGRP